MKIRIILLLLTLLLVGCGSNKAVKYEHPTPVEIGLPVPQTLDTIEIKINEEGEVIMESASVQNMVKNNKKIQLYIKSLIQRFDLVQKKYHDQAGLCYNIISTD